MLKQMMDVLTHREGTKPSATDERLNFTTTSVSMHSYDMELRRESTTAQDNACLESLLLHIRVLDTFLGYKSGPFADDVFATEYVTSRTRGRFSRRCSGMRSTVVLHTCRSGVPSRNPAGLQRLRKGSLSDARRSSRSRRGSVTKTV